MLGYKDRSEGIEQLLSWGDFEKEHCSSLRDVETVTVEECTSGSQFSKNHGDG